MEYKKDDKILEERELLVMGARGYPDHYLVKQFKVKGRWILEDEMRNGEGE